MASRLAVEDRRSPIAARQPVEREIDDRCRIEGQDLADDQPADDGDAQRVAAIPSRRPYPIASGSAPSSAAMVVIMIGRKRSRQAS